MKKFISVILLLILPGLTFAEGWSDGKIKEIRIQPSYHRIFVVQEGATNPDECEKTNYVTLMIENTLYYKELYSALLSAQATGRTVGLRLMGCTEYERPEIKEVWLK